MAKKASRAENAACGGVLPAGLVLSCGGGWGVGGAGPVSATAGSGSARSVTGLTFAASSTLSNTMAVRTCFRSRRTIGVGTPYQETAAKGMKWIS